MTYKAFVESQQKSPGKRRRMPSSSDAITQEVKGWGKDVCRCLSSRKDSLIEALQFDYCRACDFMKTSSYCQLFKLTFLADNLSKLFFFFGTVVHGLKDSLHSIGDLNNSAREIHQWCTPAAGGGGGEGNWVLNHLESRMKNFEPHLSRFKMHTQPADVHCSQ